IFYLALRGFPGVGWRGAVIVLAVSLALAWATQRVVARPVGRMLPRTLSPTRSAFVLAAGGVATAIVLVPTAAVSVDLRMRQATELEALQHLSLEYTGAEALAADVPRRPGGTSAATGTEASGTTTASGTPT